MIALAILLRSRTPTRRDSGGVPARKDAGSPTRSSPAHGAE